ncbi:hypothetical protein ABIF38_002997 [Bradyrhizobium japonicum]|uniref:Uncharacterized protein n=1 Tax=Bradyrhizobium elkanii TaxID=29448 RepID=A0ABV4FCK7_BRAEL|nr:hypothetical protein [Bradyrhizobium elkanii]NWL74090.1 hypothetical protein [Bradyrhizobium elkanii]OIM91009.1 hypothetical protein BLN97_29960 [Bradyrhizobium elkanii]
MALLEPEGGIGQLCLALYSRDDAAPLFRAKRFDVGIEQVLGFEQADNAAARSDLCTRNGACQPVVHLLAFAIHDWRPTLPRHRVGMGLDSLSADPCCSTIS